MDIATTIGAVFPESSGSLSRTALYTCPSSFVTNNKDGEISTRFYTCGRDFGRTSDATTASSSTAFGMGSSSAGATTSSTFAGSSTSISLPS
jgi:hypothetical protein